MANRAYSYVRFSTPEQSRGDSLRRQKEDSQRYAKEHGLELDETLTDLGVSAYKGKNVEGGALGKFLAAIRLGKIPKGSTLIVEALDRISRQDPMAAFRTFSDILKAGIKIVTLADKQVYTEESINANYLQIIGSIMLMVQANVESRNKSIRLKASWSNKRRNAAVKPMTGNCPAWLKAKANLQGFEIIKERQAIIKEIFELRKSGKGKYQIQKILNARQIKPWTDGKLWHYSYIGRLLENRQLIGEQQAYEIIEKKRTPAGEPISNYFPVVIPEKLFLEVNGAKKRVGGRPSKLERNLFSHLALCGYCGSSMVHTDKSEGYRYLVCSKARGGGDCRFATWRYQEFEKSFLHWIRGFDFSSVFNKQDESKLREIASSVDALNGELQEISKKLNNYADAIETGNAPSIILERIRLLEERKRQTETEKKSKENELSREQEFAASLASHTGHVVDLAKELTDVQARTRFKQEVRTLIDRIVMFPKGVPHDSRWRKAFVAGMELLNNPPADTLRFTEIGIEHEVVTLPAAILRSPAFVICFRNGVRLAVIEPKEPYNESNEGFVLENVFMGLPPEESQAIQPK